jgi:hypothetical protein
MQPPDTIEIQEGLEFVTYLKIKYRFKRFPYLVADKFGNFFMLAHCPDKRTIPFKMLIKGRGFVNYHGSQKRMPELRRKRMIVNDKYKI